MSSDHKTRQAPVGRHALIYFGKLGLNIVLTFNGKQVSDNFSNCTNRKSFKLFRDSGFSKVPFIVIVMPECFYRASSKDPGFPPNSIAGMTAP